MTSNMLLDNLQLPKIGTHFNIRRLEERDLDDLYTLVSDPELKQFMRGPVPQARNQWIAEEKGNLSSSERLAIETKADGRFAGFATLCHFLKGPEKSGSLRELHILIAKPYQGRGVGTEICNILISAAFLELNAQRIYAVVHPQNQASLKMIGKLGFELEGEISDIGSWQYGHKIYSLVNNTHQKATGSNV